MEKQFFRAFVLSLLLTVSAAISIEAYTYYFEYKGAQTHLTSMDRINKSCYEESIQKFRQDCSRQPAPYQLCLMGEGALLDASFRNCAQEREWAVQADDQLRTLKASMISVAQASIVLLIVFIFAFYGLRWVITGKIKPLIPK